MEIMTKASTTLASWKMCHQAKSGGPSSNSLAGASSHATLAVNLFVHFHRRGTMVLVVFAAGSEHVGARLGAMFSRGACLVGSDIGTRHCVHLLDCRGARRLISAR